MREGRSNWIGKADNSAAVVTRIVLYCEVARPSLIVVFTVATFVENDPIGGGVKGAVLPYHPREARKSELVEERRKQLQEHRASVYVSVKRVQDEHEW